MKTPPHGHSRHRPGPREHPHEIDFEHRTQERYSREQWLGFLNEAGLASEAGEKRVGAYSKGMRQKVGIAIAIAKKAKVLLLGCSLAPWRRAIWRWHSRPSEKSAGRGHEIGGSDDHPHRRNPSARQHLKPRGVEALLSKERAGCAEPPAPGIENPLSNL